MTSRDTLVIAGGLALGLAAGGFFLWSGASEDTQAATTNGKAVANAEDEQKPLATTPQSNSSEDLAAKVKALEVEVEQQKLLRKIDELQRQLNAKPSPSQSPRATAATPSQRTRTVQPAVVRTASRPRTTSQSPGKATLSYWNQMNDVIEREAVMRTPPAGGVTKENAGEFLERRIEAYEFACNTIRGLGRDSVDSSVVELAMGIADWYEEGIEVCSRGKGLMDYGSVRDRKGTPGKQWQAAEKKHNLDVNALNQRGARVRDAMQRKYKLPFPPLK